MKATPEHLPDVDVAAAAGGSDHENPKAGLPAGRSGGHVSGGIGTRGIVRSVVSQQMPRRLLTLTSRSVS